MNVNPDLEKNNKTIDDPTSREFLPAALEIMETPPRPLGRILAVVIGAFFVIAIVWAALSPIDIVAVADGKVVPTGQIKVVQPFQSGVVNAINVREGIRVDQGDILIELDATEAETNRQRVELDLARAELDHAIAIALLSHDPGSTFVAPQEIDVELVRFAEASIHERWQNFQSSLAENTSEYQRLESTIVALQAQEQAGIETLNEVDALYASLEKLDAVGLSTNSQIANMRLQLISNKSQLQNLTQSIAQAELELIGNAAQRRRITSSFMAEVNGQLTDARQAILVATQELERLREREDLYFLKAPVSGTVNEILVHTIGAVVSPSERLLTIVPDDVQMEIEANLENKDIGFIRVGQVAEIKLEAFPFTRFGVLDAEVIHISPDAVIDPNRGPLFAIRVAPDRSAIISGDTQIRLGPGMRATAEIKTGKRTVLEFFLTPLLRYRDEAIRER